MIPSYLMTALSAAFTILVIAVFSREWVFYTDIGVSEGSAGGAHNSVICIRPKYRGDVGLLEHERIHVRQFWRNPILFNFRYAFGRHYRLQYEAEAYAAQANCYADDRVPVLAARLANKYDLGITPEIAERAIREAM